MHLLNSASQEKAGINRDDYMATKDYDDYIDWTYANGYDPADYETYQEYLDDVIKKVPPIHHNEWESRSKKKLDNQLINYFQQTVQFEKAAEKAPKGAIISDSPAVKRKKRIRAKDQSGFMVRNLKKKQKHVSNTQSKQIVSIENKRVTGKKFTKTERKLLNKTILLRANELRKEFNYSKSESFKRAHVEFK